MYLRDLPGTTLSQFADTVNDVSEANQVSGTEVRLALTDSDPHINIGEIQVPMTSDGLEALGRYVGVQPTFLYPKDRAFDVEEAEWVLSRRLSRLGNTMTVLHNETGIQGVYAPGAQPINPRRTVEVAMRVLDPASPIIEYRSSADEMFFDVVVPFESVQTGDATTNLSRGEGDSLIQQVGDLTAAGLRFTQNRARNLAPQVDPFAYRLWCTNGMSLLDDTLPKMDARIANGVGDVMAQLEARAQAAFAIVEGQIQHFYDMRNQIVEDPAAALLRLGNEMGIGDPTINRIARVGLPALVEAGNQASMFDLVNLITNEANNPAYSNRANLRRNLEGVGGSLVSLHSERCNHCHSKLQ